MKRDPGAIQFGTVHTGQVFSWEQTWNSLCYPKGTREHANVHTRTRERTHANTDTFIQR
jgi:hypothetical protein